MAKHILLEVECQECSGTGLYVGVAEPVGTAVVCCKCYGTGRFQFYYKPFSRRKGRRNIKVVKAFGYDDTTMTYKEFQSNSRYDIGERPQNDQ